ncbi:hypothetical protein A3L04_07220 [Thermococcus chitonophagus]|uniref:DUF2207 domain-containing protein n=1 Tax=Thermococcus chitonophagus TaxID=54262 RepID=A0A170SPU9_9EURY|nr:hypothetical protein [Thermococcus chitonophagus]ASJ16878.1 hypothetical protein A3L04_07220 [Thermococcus chitonophagus]CUX78358.1 hypothetical protein CHITON_1579 [Thermococcus chitonophagus]
MIKVKDSVEVALELDEKGVYSHIAHESAEDIIRIISAIDAERAKLRGMEVYHRDDWDLLIRERIRKGKRHTAFDFYNPELLEIWEEKVKSAKRDIRVIWYYLFGLVSGIVFTAIGSIFTGYPIFIIGLAMIPLAFYIVDYQRSKADLKYYELVQFFIYELKSILEKFELKKEKYKFQLYNTDYREVAFERGKAMIR